MVRALEHKQRDPMFPKMNRGPGYYYFRGDLKPGTIKGHRGPYWSKYDEHLDAAKLHKMKRVEDIGKSEDKMPHKADYKTRRVGNRVIKTTRKGSGPRGYF